VVFSGVGLGLFAFAAYERDRLDPLFAPIRCDKIHMPSPVPTIEAPDLGPGNHSLEAKALALSQTFVTMSPQKKKSCHNPNQFTLTLSSTADGIVSWETKDDDGNDILYPVARAVGAPAPLNILPAGGHGIRFGTVEFNVSMLIATKMFITAPSDLIHKTPMRVTTELTMLGMPIKVVKDFDNYCRQIINYATQEDGEPDCGESLDELTAPSLDIPKPNVTYLESASTEGDDFRDMVCGLIMGIGLLQGLCCACCGVCIVRRRPKASGDNTGTDVKKDDPQLVAAVYDAEKGNAPLDDQAAKTDPPPALEEGAFDSVCGRVSQSVFA